MKTVFKNAKVFVGDSEPGPTTCLIINDATIDYVGAAEDGHVSAAINEGADVVDLHGKTIAPGFIDGHMHMLLFGSSLFKIELEFCKSLKDIRDTIRNAAKQKPDAKRLFCQGWMQDTTDGEALASMIDDIDPRPIFISSKDLHSCWCSSSALAELGVEDMPNPEGGEIHRDENGRASGLLSEAAALKIVWPHTANVMSAAENLNHVRAAIRAYNAAGYTGVVEMATDEQVWSLMKKLKETEVVPLRFAAHWLIIPSKTDEENLAQVDHAIELHRKYNLQTSPNFRIAGIKVICDGVIDACTAALTKPYTSNATNCDPLWPSEALRKVVQKADAAGLQCALHAIGDATVKLAVDTLEAVGTPGRRHRIEHLEMTRPEDAKRLGTLGITASVQPVHSDPSILRAWPKLLGDDRCDRAFAYKEFLDNNAKIAIGTDSPTAPHLPFPNLYNATTRRSAREPELTATMNEHFKLTLGEAMAAASAGSAYSCFADSYAGSLKPRKKADFVIADMDWTTEGLLQASVLQTWFDGKCVYQK